MSLAEWSSQNVFPKESFFMNRFLNESEDYFDSKLEMRDIPAINVSETDEEIEVELVAPCKSIKDFEVKVSDNILTISTEQEPNDNNTKEYTRHEYNYSAFKRSYRLPENVINDSIITSYENGLLKITISKNV